LLRGIDIHQMITLLEEYLIKNLYGLLNKNITLKE
jgi:hypothetical protein